LAQRGGSSRPKSDRQHPQVLDVVDATEQLLGFHESRSHPAQRHVLIAPALHTVGRGAHDAVGVLDDVGRAQAAHQRGRQSELVDREDLFQPFEHESGAVSVLGHQFNVDKHWVRRLVRCEVDFTLGRIRFYALRRREPTQQPLLREVPCERPDRAFLGT
jgi:hypothetical protein